MNLDPQMIGDEPISLDETIIFDRLLDKLLFDYDFDKGASVLNIGCGKMFEIESLKSRYGVIVGVDSGNEVKEYYQENKPDGFKFIPGDIRELDELVQTPFDIVILRHPDFIYEKKNGVYTRKIRQQTGQVLLATNYNQYEFDLTKKALKRGGFKVVNEGRNELALVISPSANIGVDLYYIVVEPGKKLRQIAGYLMF